MPVTEPTGFLHDDIPNLKIGHGPPLVTVLGLTPEHDVPRGWGRRWQLGLAGPLARHFTVYLLNRKRGLRPGESMSDIAGHLVSAVEHDLGQPAFLQGASTGGSVALQLAVDRPELVRRLVVVSAAHRLGPRGRALQGEMARLVRADAPRDAWASAMTTLLRCRHRAGHRGERRRHLHRGALSGHRRGRPERTGTPLRWLGAPARLHVCRDHPPDARLHARRHAGSGGALTSSS